MQRTVLRDFRARAFLALTLLAWLVGSAWHGAMQIGVVLGQPVCSVQGAKFLPADAPAPPGQAGGKNCPLCAAFGAPASASALVAIAAPIMGPADSALLLDLGAVLPAAHLADLATRAPPRA